MTLCFSVLFFFNDTATTEIYTLSLHDALPILSRPGGLRAPSPAVARRPIVSAGHAAPAALQWRGAPHGGGVACGRPRGDDALVPVRQDQYDEPPRERAQGGPVAQGGAGAGGDRVADLRTPAWKGEPVRPRAWRRQRATANLSQPHGRGARLT